MMDLLYRMERLLRINCIAWGGIVLCLVGIVWTGARVVVDDLNKTVLREAARAVLREAKRSPPEHGVYTLDDVCPDYWGNAVAARLAVGEHANTVELCSSGRSLENVGDDVCHSETDIHVRELLKAGVEATGRSWGKGLAQGVMEGVREGSAEGVQATKAKASELLSRFRKMEEREYAPVP